MKFDAYTLNARIFPAIITGIPCFVLFFYISSNGYGDLLSYLASLKFFGSLTISGISVYAFGLIISTYGKALENRYFHKKNGFPTTYLMLYENKQYSNDYKDKFRKKVKEILKLDLLNLQDEKDDKKEAIRRLNESAKQLILNVGSGKLVQQQNIWYGFRRNLSAGALFAFVLSAFSAVAAQFIFHNNIMTITFIVLMILYAGIFLMKGFIMQIAGEEFAKQLIAEFMNS